MRIWTRSGEVKVVGETSRSWVISAENWENEKFEEIKVSNPRWYKTITELVPKKEPNDNLSYKSYFFSEEEWKLELFAGNNRYKITRFIETLDPATLKVVADVAGYKEAGKE